MVRTLFPGTVSVAVVEISFVEANSGEVVLARLWLPMAGLVRPVCNPQRPHNSQN
jgi:hypothetical protein